MRKLILGLLLVTVFGVMLGNAHVRNNAETVPPGLSPTMTTNS